MGGGGSFKKWYRFHEIPFLHYYSSNPYHLGIYSLDEIGWAKVYIHAIVLFYASVTISVELHEIYL